MSQVLIVQEHIMFFELVMHSTLWVDNRRLLGGLKGQMHHITHCCTQQCWISTHHHHHHHREEVIKGLYSGPPNQVYIRHTHTSAHAHIYVCIPHHFSFIHGNIIRRNSITSVVVIITATKRITFVMAQVCHNLFAHDILSFSFTLLNKYRVFKVSPPPNLGDGKWHMYHLLIDHLLS